MGQLAAEVCSRHPRGAFYNLRLVADAMSLLDWFCQPLVTEAPGDRQPLPHVIREPSSFNAGMHTVVALPRGNFTN